MILFLQNLVHPEVDPLNDVPAVVEHPPDVLCVHGTGEVGVAMMGTVLLSISPTLLLADLKEIVSDEVFGSCELLVCTLVHLWLGLRRQHVVNKLGEKFF